MIDRNKIMELLNIKSENPSVLSLYLDLTGGPRRFRPALRNMIREEKDRLIDEKILSEELIPIVEDDFYRIQQYIDNLNRQRGLRKGIAIFSFNKGGLWEVFNLPGPVMNSLYVCYKPQLRPIIQMMELYRRTVIVILSKDRARIFKYFNGDLAEFSQISTDVPERVKKAGFYGREERGIERHIKDHVRGHLKAVSEILDDINSKSPFDWLIIGSNTELAEELKNVIPSEMSRKIRCVIPIELDIHKRSLYKKVMEVEKELKEKDDRELVNELFNSLGPSGLGVSGLNETLYCLYQGDAQILLVEEGFSKEGGICLSCGFLSVEVDKCPICSIRQLYIKDVISEAMALAVKKNCRVAMIQKDLGLEKLGRIGAILRYKR
jgi:peptide subunit release factor 1 (eRF1)